MKTKRLSILGSILILILLQVPSASALSAGDQSSVTCKEVTQYYNPAKNELLQGDVSPNNFTLCQNNHFDLFPGQHKQGNELSAHQAVKTFHEPWTEHRHSYTNESEEKLENGWHIFQFSATDTFELKLHNDFLQNIDFNTVQCAGLPDGNNCNGEGNFGNASDGGLVKYTVTFDKNAGIIRWHFPGKKGNANYGSVGNANWSKLYLTGKNPTLDEFYGINANSPNSSLKEDNRKLSLAINFKSKNINDDFWSATVTSRTLIKDVQKKIRDGVDNIETIDNTALVDVPHTTAPEAPSTNYYWFPIGTTSTIWQKDLPPPPNTCQTLSIKLTPNTVVINGKDSYPIKVDSVTFAPQNQIPQGAKVKWTSDDPNGEFWKSKQGGTYEKIGIGTVTVDNVNLQLYYIGTKNAEIKAELTNIPENQMGSSCYAYVKIPIEEIRCKELKVDHPKTIYAGTVSTFNSKSIGTDNQNFPNKIKYWVSPGYGEFYLIKPANIPDNPSENVWETGAMAADIMPFTVDSIIINPNILIAGNDEKNVADAVIEISNELITGQFGIEDISGNISNFEQLQEAMAASLIELPDWMTSGIFPKPGPTPDPNPADMYPGSFGQTNSLLALNFDSGSLIDPGALSPTGAIDKLTPDTLIGPNIGNLFETITVDANTPIYFWAKKPGKAVVHVQVVATSNPGCKRDFDIIELPVPDLYCDNIHLQTDKPSPITAGETITIDIAPTDQNGNFLPDTTKFDLSTTAGGKFTSKKNPQIILQNQVPVSQFPVQFKESNKAGKAKVEINQKDPAYSDVCAGTVDVKEVQKQACLRFDGLKITEFNGAGNLEKLEPGKVYTVETGLSTELASNETITYTIEKQYGVFIKVGPQLMPVIAAMIKNLPAEALTFDFLSSNLPPDSLTYEVTAPEYEHVLLVTFSNAPASKTDVLKIKATAYANPECTKLFALVIPEQPKDCKNIELTPVQAPFDPKVANIFNITGDYKDYAGEIKITISSTTSNNKPSISKIGGQPVTDSITFSKDELKDQAIAKSFAYNPNGYDEDTDSLTITVDAIGSANAACKKTLSFNAKGQANECIDLEIIEPDSPWEIDDNDDEQLFQISVDTNPSNYKNDLYYNWEVTESDAEWQGDDEHIRDKGDFTQILEDFDEDTEVEVWASTGDNKDYIKDSSGNIICRDTISAKQAKKEKEKPEIEKLAYPENDKNDADDTINITGKTDFVTYVIKFTVGTDIKEAKIWDSELKPNGIIENIYADTNGNLDFDNMRIIFVDDDNDETVVFNSKNYQDKDYEENACNNGNKACIDINDNSHSKKEFKDYIVNKFSKGEKLTFKNLDNSKVETIRIEYEMTYKNPITDQKCQTLVAACGEQFKNKAKFTAKSKTNNNKEYEGDATTKVIAICPYILTRQGGDVFFHDVIETGIDVAQCSEVKSCDGPCITPTPPPTPTTPKTGAGDIPEDFIKLDLPSHDVCRYSNSANNLEGYNNVLKNFSSTICELQADISKAWTKKNITDSINANVKRISRWEENLNINNLRSVDALNNLSNSKSGVFVRKSGDLKINGIDGYIVQSTDKVPAAQTYIVIGHDLYIDSDIKYGPTDYTQSKKIPSAAFIVINGNIIINNDVKQIDGILMAVDLDDSGDGKVKNPQLDIPSYVTLTINGNLIGDVYDLFYSRRGVGDPLKDEGSVTVRYDERILLNTPPGISDLINLKQAIVP